MRNLSQAPDRVMMPLIMPPHEGASRIRENTMPRVCAQSGSVEYCRWCGPAPHVDRDERPEVHDRKPVGVNRPAGLLGHEVIHHPEKAGGEKKTDRVMAVPPFHHGIGRTGVGGIGLRETQRQLRAVDDMEHRGGNNERAVKPVRDVLCETRRFTRVPKNTIR